jgi:hypothetical protein
VRPSRAATVESVHQVVLHRGVGIMWAVEDHAAVSIRPLRCWLCLWQAWASCRARNPACPYPCWAAAVPAAAALHCCSSQAPQHGLIC